MGLERSNLLPALLNKHRVPHEARLSQEVGEVVRCGSAKGALCVQQWLELDSRVFVLGPVVNEQDGIAFLVEERTCVQVHPLRGQVRNPGGGAVLGAQDPRFRLPDNNVVRAVEQGLSLVRDVLRQQEVVYLRIAKGSVVDGVSIAKRTVLNLGVEELQVLDLAEDVVDLGLPLLKHRLHLELLQAAGGSVSLVSAQSDSSRRHVAGGAALKTKSRSALRLPPSLLDLLVGLVERI